MSVSDTEIRCEARSLLNRLRLDLQKLQIRVTNGTLRLGGELAYMGATAGTAVPGGAVEGLEQDLKRLRGVKHAHLAFTDWRRLSTGQWEQVQRRELVPKIPAGWTGTAPVTG